MAKKIYLETGMFMDWSQLERVSSVDTLIDVGVGPKGTENLYHYFNESKLLLFDPLDEAEEFFRQNLRGKRDAEFFKIALGSSESESIINVQSKMGNSSLLDVSEINYQDDNFDKRPVMIRRLDKVLEKRLDLGTIGIKVDVEGYELEVLKGCEGLFDSVEFIMAEVRHNYESFKGVYTLNDFTRYMAKKGFVLDIIFTAKPFIADLLFVKNK